MNDFQIDLFDIDGTLADTTILGQSELGSSSNEGAFHAPQISRLGTWPLDAV